MAMNNGLPRQILVRRNKTNNDSIYILDIPFPLIQ